MKFSKLLVVLAVIGVSLGVLSFTHGTASASGVGGNIEVQFTGCTSGPPSFTAQACTTPANTTDTIYTNQWVDVSVALTGPGVDDFFAFNTSLAYDSSKLTLNSITSPWVTGFSCGGASTTLASTFGGGLVAPLVGGVLGCSSSGGPAPAASLGVLAVYHFQGSPAAAATGVHMVLPAELASFGGAAVSSFSTYTLNNADLTVQSNTYSCKGNDGTSTNVFPVPGAPTANCLVIAPPPGNTPSPFYSLAINIVLPPGDVAVTKSASIPSVVAGQPDSFTIHVSDTGSGTATETVTITDNAPAGSWTVNTAATANVVGTPVLGANCTTASQTYTCTATMNPGDSFDINLAVTTLGTAGGTSPCNIVNQTSVPVDTAPANDTAQACIQIIPPAVAWSKTPTTGNLWLSSSVPPCDPTNASGQCFGQQVNVWKFDEVMTNQGDPNGLGGFSFDIHYDPTQYLAPTVDLTPAINFFANGSVAHPRTWIPRALTCSMTIPLNGVFHVACASTGTMGSGPGWVGSEVMAHVTMVPQSLLVESIRPNKENGDVSTVKDDQVTVTNTCGQPLNDGTIQPLPGQPECQGNPLQGVGPGGVLTGNPNGGETTATIRRLEGDVTGDCSVNISDMQLEATKFGTSTGSLLYSQWFDVNSPLQHGDGEIDINDIQFVFGRAGSECSNPIPAQPALPPAP